MRKCSRILLAIGAALLMVVAVMKSQAVIQGAKDGLTLCMQVIIPSIFPFLFFSMLMCNYWKGIHLRFLTPICNATGIPENAQSILLLAVIGGYPVGAQAVVQAYNSHYIQKNKAQRLLGFCNNAGPSFIFGLLGTMFENQIIPLLLWLIHIGSAMIVGALLPNKQSNSHALQSSNKENIPGLLRAALQITAIICGWVIIFRILLCLLDEWLLLQAGPLLRVIIYGLLELSNGCVALPLIGLESIRFIVASAMLSAGGLCVLMQTKSVTGDIGICTYLTGKVMQTALSVFLSCLISPFVFQSFPPISIILVSLFCFFVTLFAVKRKKVVALCA